MESTIEGADALAMGFGDAVQRLQRLARRRLLLLLRLHRRQRDRLGLQLQSEGIHFFGFLGRKRPYKVSAIGLGADQPLLLEPCQGLAERDLTHARSEEHTSELQSLMRISYAVFCLHTTNHQSLEQN